MNDAHDQHGFDALAWDKALTSDANTTPPPETIAEWIAHRRLVVLIAAAARNRDDAGCAPRIVGLIRAQRPSRRTALVAAVRRRAGARRPRRWPLIWSVAALLACMIGGVLFVGVKQIESHASRVVEVAAAGDHGGQRVDQAQARIIASSGTVQARTLHETGSTILAATTSNNLHAGDRLITGPDGMCEVRWNDGSTVMIMPNALMDFDAADSPRLDHGRMSAHIAHQLAGHHFSIQTPQATVTVIGTRFSLMVNNDSTHLTVDEGSVRIVSGTDQATVVAGGQALASVAHVRTLRVLHADDFEQSTPTGAWTWYLGRRTPPLQTNGSNWCLASADSTADFQGCRAAPRVPLVYSTDQAVTFDVFCEDRDEVSLQVRNETAGQWFSVRVPCVRGVWTRVTVPMADFHGNIDIDRRYRSGEPIDDVLWYVPRGGAGFRIDNVAWVSIGPTDAVDKK